ncbi:ComEA family DNA-binding protein [Rothia sp. (in: high G+C Gram-positive bacteria)]|uniref:ComEA family DNA-binding protein n=1 Tax=Rothia sp. (in: high G+C Gram-positive bacteria) TaxID=1885016 RepID=UPI001CADA8D7|nr:ComEA family DNA-binding protein [Rothia sp. (in: high G+C Gram-positive bacteria)]MBF1655620.1 helix-hairpin-helix domain-containing protein [Rothia sp. (in: high G+C Gram-positive bacteria)]
MTSMTPNHEQNAVQSPVQDSAAQQGGTPQPGGAQRSARSLMNSLYRSPRARKNGAPDAEDTVPLAISTEVTPAEVPAEETPAEPAASQPESNGWADWDQQPDWNEVDDWAEWEQADQPGTTRSTRWGLSPRVLLLVAVLALVAVAWGVTQFSAAPRAEQVASPSASAESVQAVGAQQSPATQSAAQATAQPSESAQGGPSGEATVRVHVAGAVNNPGVYTLPAQGRAVDAIAAASGAAADADLDRVNLAGALSDGVQIYVPHRGETAAPAQIQPNGGTANAGQGNAANGAAQNGAAQNNAPQPARTLTPAGSAQKGSTPVNINTATAEELQTLPRIGPAMAQRIIAWREAHGGFRSVDELDAVPGIGPSMLENLRPLVTI